MALSNHDTVRYLDGVTRAAGLQKMDLTHNPVQVNNLIRALSSYPI